MKLTRRQLAGMGAAAATAGAAMAQTAPPAPTSSDQAARENNKRSADALSQIELPISTEPAFHFKA